MPYSFEQFLSARSAYGPTVDADGSRLYLLSDLTGAPALWSRSLGEGPAWPEPVAVGLDRVSAAYPSGRPGRLALAADSGGNERTQLYLLDGPGLLPRRLTDDDAAIHLFGGWHPDGRTIAYSSNERDPAFFDVYTLDVESGARRLVFRDDGTYHAGRFAPDGASLLVRRVDSPSDQLLLVLELEMGGVSWLTERDRPTRYDHPAWSADGRSVYCTTDRDRDFLAVGAIEVATKRLSTVVESAWDAEDFALAPDGGRLVYVVNADGYSEVWARDLAGGAGDVKLECPVGQAFDNHRWPTTFSWLPDGSGVALTISTPTMPPEVFLARSAGTAERVTRSWSAGLAADELVAPELVHYPTFDGRQIPAFVYQPKQAGAGRGQPALFFVHGGPESQIRPSFNPVIQYFATRGYLVVAPNVRGSSGYGNEYVHLDDVEHRMDAVRDLAAGAEWVARAGLADRRGIAVMGASYGGFMVLAALTEYPELWAAGVDIVGIANFVTFLENTGPWRRRQREAEYGSLEHHRALLEEISPIRKVDRIAAPLMVIHGANDPRVPIGETEQIVASLRQRGRPVEYLRFEDEGHGLAKLRNRLVAYPQIDAFLRVHLDGG